MLRADPEKQRYKLVLAGSNGWGNGKFTQQLAELGLDQQVLRLGYVADSDLPALYAGATLFVFPSLHEGFGLPPLEAMACGTPVLTSSQSAMSEVCAEAAAYVDPLDVAAMTHALCDLLNRPKQLAHLRDAGLQRAAAFSWERTARETVSVYQLALKQSD